MFTTFAPIVVWAARKIFSQPNEDWAKTEWVRSEGCSRYPMECENWMRRINIEVALLVAFWHPILFYLLSKAISVIKQILSTEY